MTIGGAIGSFYMFWRLHTDYKLLEIDLQMALEKLQDCVGLCRELKEELDKEIYNEEIQKKNRIMTKKRKLNSKNPKYIRNKKDEPVIEKRVPLGTTGRVFAVFLKNN